MKQMRPLNSRHAKLLFNFFVLSVFAFFFVTCRPPSLPQSGSDLEEEEPVSIKQESSLTRDLSDYQTYESTGLGIRLRHPPEMSVTEPADTAGTLQLQQTSSEDAETAETQLNVRVQDSVLYSDTVALAGDNPVTFLETVVLPQYDITEIVQSPTAVDLNGLSGAVALVHERTAVGLEEPRSKYLAVILDGDRVLLLEADTTVAGESTFLPVAQTIVNSLEVNRGLVP